MQCKCITKKRLVWCVHITTFVFSVLALACSAFSYYYSTIVSWTGNYHNNRLLIQSSGGQIFLQRMGDWWDEDREFQFVIFDYSVKDSERLEALFRFDRAIENSQFLGLRFVSIGRHPHPNVMNYGIPYAFLLVIPMTWLCGFYLFKLYQRRRARLAATTATT